MFSDLECDYLNPIDLCNKLNQVSGSLAHPHHRYYLPLALKNILLPSHNMSISASASLSLAESELI